MITIERFRIVVGYYPNKTEAALLIAAEYDKPDSVLRTENGARQFISSEAEMHGKRVKSKIPIGINLLRMALDELRQQAHSRNKRQNARSGRSPL